MDTAELLSSFNKHVDQYASHREYVSRAQSMMGRFSPEVVEKVVMDHEIRASGVAEEVLPLVPMIEGRVGEIDAERASIESGKADSDAKMEELTLRQAIGELSDEDFERESAELSSVLDAANGQLDALNAERAELAGALERWVELAAQGNQNDGTASSEPEPEPEPEVVEEDVVVESDDDAVDVDVDVDVDVEIDEPVIADDEGQHASTDTIKEDLSAVFESSSAASVQVDDDAGEAIEAGDYGFEVGDDEEGGDDEVELNLDGGGSGEDTGDEIGIDLDVGVDDIEEGSGDEENDSEERRAILLYSEGSPDEQIYPFERDVLSIGRGRDNDIQIKNDSKVSRFHCRLFRRGGQFYIEDNKSSNGTLVNGELITERRLFGGEEIIIGETFFRFRIM